MDSSYYSWEVALQVVLAGLLAPAVVAPVVLAVAQVVPVVPQAVLVVVPAVPLVHPAVPALPVVLVVPAVYNRSRFRRNRF